MNVTTKRIARAWRYREQLREILDRKQINVVSEMLEQWCANVMRSKVDPMKDVSRMIHSHFAASSPGPRRVRPTASWKPSKDSFQAAKREARGYTNLTIMRTVLFLIAGKLDFLKINPHVA
ncbi:MAG: transposase [Burkholderia sp.]